MCVRDVSLVCFYHFCIGIWNSVAYFAFHFMDINECWYIYNDYSYGGVSDQSCFSMEVEMTVIPGWIAVMKTSP